MDKSVTVVVVNWNGGSLLIECLQKLKEQSLQANHIILMDNASTDGSADLAAAIDGVTVQKLEKNYGFAKANNIALNQCQDQFIALLNPDALADKFWLEHLVNMASAHPEFVTFGSRQMMLNNPGYLDGTGDTYHFSGLAWRTGYASKLTYQALDCREIFSPCACAALYHTDVLKRLGGFDEDFFCYMEDVDLGFRLQLNQYRCFYVADAVVHHAGSALTGGRHSASSIYYGHRNLVWTFVKNMPAFLFYPLLPVHCLLTLISLVYFSFKGQGRVIIRAKKDALMGLPKIWRKRK